MSGARRTYDLIRAYVNHGWDQVTDRDEQAAQEELKQALGQPVMPRSIPSATPETIEPMNLEAARNLFDLQPNASSGQITSAYDKLREATDLKKFTEGSESFQRARALRRRIDAARQVLIENVDPTVRRFEHLEIE